MSLTAQKFLEKLQTAEGGSWTAEDLGHLFQVGYYDLQRMRRKKTIIWWRTKNTSHPCKGALYYPKWQFDAHGCVLPSVQSVLAILPQRDEWRIMSYFLGKRAQLDGLRPIDLLRQGETQRVLEHAKRHVVENTW